MMVSHNRKIVVLTVLGLMLVSSLASFAGRHGRLYTVDLDPRTGPRAVRQLERAILACREDPTAATQRLLELAAVDPPGGSFHEVALVEALACAGTTDHPELWRLVVDEICKDVRNPYAPEFQRLGLCAPRAAGDHARKR